MTTMIAALAAAKKGDDGRHVLSIMKPGEGDLKVTWDPENEIEVEAARKAFNDLKKKGMAAFSVKMGGRKGKVLNDFDPDIEAMIMAPAMVGG